MTEPLASSNARLLVVLRKPPARQDSPKVVKEPDFDKIGGSVISRHDGVIEIDLPLAAAKHLVDDDNVAYIQRVWMGEPLDDWTAPTATATSSKLHVRTLETGSNLSWASGAFAYDGSGNIKKIGNDDYVYDSALRLIQSVVHGTAETYKYDSFGNLNEKTLAGAAPGIIPVDPGSNRISGVSYDAIGDQLNDSSGQARYVYDSMGMMTGVVGTTGFPGRRMIYTADDERIGIAIDSSFTRWRLRDFNTNQVLREWSSSNNMSWQWEQDFVYGDGKLVAAESVPYVGGRRHFSLDHLGNVRLVTSDGAPPLAYGRHDYYPFGVEQTSSIQAFVNFNFYPPDPMKFAGHERYFLGNWGVENTDYLDDMHARYYNPNAARFLSVDPANSASIRSPQSWNRYAYVSNNPLRYIDPTGAVRRDANGQIVFTPRGKVDPNFTNGDRRLGTMQPGYIRADNGRRVEAFRNVGGSSAYQCDCHGLTFADGKYWINNDQVNKLLRGHGYKRTAAPQAGDVAVFSANGEVVHSMTVTGVDDKGKVNEVTGLGGTQPAARSNTPEQIQQEFGTLLDAKVSVEYYHDSKPDRPIDEKLDQVKNFEKPKDQ